MVHQITYFKDAFSAWEQWNLTDFDYKCEHLLAFKSAIEEQHSVAGKVVSYHLQQASALLAETHQLVGLRAKLTSCTRRGVVWLWSFVKTT